MPSVPAPVKSTVKKSASEKRLAFKQKANNRKTSLGSIEVVKKLQQMDLANMQADDIDRNAKKQITISQDLLVLKAVKTKQ